MSNCERTSASVASDAGQLMHSDDAQVRRVAASAERARRKPVRRKTARRKSSRK